MFTTNNAHGFRREPLPCCCIVMVFVFATIIIIIDKQENGENDFMLTRVAKVNPIQPERTLIAEAAEVIVKGGLVAFPTETVYGLGANAFNDDAVRKIFAVKNRPPDNPLIVHISDLEMIHRVALDVPEKAWKLIEKAWPGPLTVILKKRREVPKAVTGGLDTVAVRLPGHPVAIELIETADTPVAAPSANLSGRPSPITAEHVIKDLWGKIDMIIDGGETFFGVESTVVNVLHDPPVLLRPGPVGVEEIEAIIGEKIVVPEWARGYAEQTVPESPGMKYRHYSPVTPIILVEAYPGNREGMIRKIKEIAKEEKKRRKIVVITSSENNRLYEEEGIRTVVIGSAKNLYEVARNLYRVLREIDELEVDIAISESFDEKGIGLAIMNRLRKASTLILKV